MPKMWISGQVLYSDLSPAVGATVRIYELDLLPGGSHDKILGKTTDVRGRFRGLSAEWKDREGKGLFGSNIPDVMNLEFRVAVDGKTHKGPFMIAAGNSAPIVLPFGPPRPISRGERDLVQLIRLSNGYTGPERALYEFIEVSSQGVAATILGPQYRRIHVLRGAEATLTGFKNALRSAASTAGVEAVDVLLNSHGLTDGIEFDDGVHKAAAIHAELSDLSADVRGKLRAMFSTACFGASHLSTWNSIGFTAAIGSVGIYADSAVSFAPMLARWAGEGSLADAVAVANAADVGNAMDELARAYYSATQRQTLADQVDSTRRVVGEASIRIHARP
ncbi:MAG: hypothetical protein MUC36_23265 [Planctomycetes bacterium]|jgi:hypothetical protein|nr:hypothetical protein [Planctomycetota bacterium]